MDATAAGAAASALADAWREGGQIDELAEAIRPTDLTAAYDVQSRMVDAIAERPVGWKVGASNAAAMERFGFAEPFYGRLLAGGMHDRPGRAARGSFRAPRAGDRVRVPPRPPICRLPRRRSTAPPWSPPRPSWSRRSRSSIPASRAWPEVSPFSFIADNGTHGCFVMGRPARRLARP